MWILLSSSWLESYEKDGQEEGREEEGGRNMMSTELFNNWLQIVIEVKTIYF